MPFYSPSDRAITLRIVYDGLGTAGKTTNVQKLHEIYAMRRQGPIIVPEVVHGRTAFFDWIELTVGTLDDRYELRCQILTVPGQFAYAPRRWQLLQHPDAVVCVCDSSQAGMRRSRLGLDFLRELRTRGVCPSVPIIIQANKRDLPDAVPLESVPDHLALTDGEPVVPAVANSGEGVQITFFRALDAARGHLRSTLEGRDLSSLAPPETPDELLAKLKVELTSVNDEAYSLVEAINARSAIDHDV